MPAMSVRIASSRLVAAGAINRYLSGVAPLFVLMGLVVYTADIGAMRTGLPRGSCNRSEGGSVLQKWPQTRFLRPSRGSRLPPPKCFRA